MTARSAKVRQRVLVLVGTKAQFIKTAPVLRAFDEAGLGYRLVYTGQHSETFGKLEAAFGTRPPDDNLVPFFEAADHASFFRWSLKFWSAAWLRIRQGDWRDAKIALVHGDTASTLFGAVAARLGGLRVAHIEAGLRSSRLLEPFPEEIVRRLVSRLSSWHFAPDAQAAANLADVRGAVVDTSGNTLRDALAMAMRSNQKTPSIGGSGSYGVVSIHRSENLSSQTTFNMLMQVVLEASMQGPLRFVLHPVTRRKILAGPWRARLEAAPNLYLVERMDYPEFVRLLIGASFLLTDGGSNQEEAAMLGLPTLLLRRATERPDGLGANVVLSGLEPERIRAFVRQNCGGIWPVGIVGGPSPSALIASYLTSAVDT